MWQRLGQPPDRGARRPAADDRPGVARDHGRPHAIHGARAHSPTRTCAASSSRRAVNLSLEHGNSDGSCQAYVLLGKILGPRFGDYDAAFRFGKLGFDLVEKRGPLRFKARVYSDFAHHGQSLDASTSAPASSCMRRAFEAAQETGDLQYRVLHAQRHRSRSCSLPAIRSARCERSAEDGARVRAEGEVRPGRRHPHRAAQAHPAAPGIDRSASRRSTATDFDEGAVRAAPAKAIRASRSPPAGTGSASCRGASSPATTRAALEAAAKAQTSRGRRRRSSRSPSTISTRALAHAARHDAAPADERPSTCRRSPRTTGSSRSGRRLPRELREPRRAGRRRARAPRRRSARRPTRLYEQAIRSARENGFVHNEAIAYETAARFYRGAGFDADRRHLPARGARPLSPLGRRRQGARHSSGGTRSSSSPGRPGRRRPWRCGPSSSTCSRWSRRRRPSRA